MDNKETDRRPIIQPSIDVVAYIAWLVSRDLMRWGPDRETDLDREEMTALCLFLRDHLPPERAALIDVPPLDRQLMKAV